MLLAELQRGLPMEQLTPGNPAVLHLIAHVIQTASRAGTPVAVCGEMAGEPTLTRLLLGFGLFEEGKNLFAVVVVDICAGRREAARFNMDRK